MKRIKRQDGYTDITATGEEFQAIKNIILYESENYDDLDWTWHERTAAQFLKLRQALEHVNPASDPVTFHLDSEDDATLGKAISYAASLLGEQFENSSLIEILENSLHEKLQAV